MNATLPFSIAYAVALLAGCSGSGSGETGSPGGSGAGGTQCGSSPAVVGPEIAITDRGPLRGTIDGDVVSHLGIPFARPPIAERRWRPPEQRDCWTEIRDATAHGSACMQIGGDGAIKGSEDCLTVDVYAPIDAVGLPVLFYIHGGDNILGSNTEYDGRELARRGKAVVVVTNYRLNVFGWLAHPSFANEDNRGSSGNYALLDQIEALRWTQTNIAHFGGDPRRVLVFGQSAGATNTCSLIASPLASGLFSGALMQSGNCFSMSAQTVADTAKQTSDALGCTGATDVAACMRDKPAESVVLVPGAGTSDLSVKSDFNPSVDGVVLPKPQAEALALGSHNHVPLVIGTTADEYANVLEYFVTKPIVTVEDYEQAIAQLFGVGATTVLAVYPAADYPTPRDAMVAVFGDLAQHCPSRRAARSVAKSQDEPVRRFLFSYGFESGPLAAFGAAHGHDVAFFWHDFSAPGPTPSEQKLSDAMIRYLVQFAARGDPNTPELPPWPQNDTASEPYLVLDEPISQGSGFRDAQCDFWDSLLGG
jgi:para-nitrobenzyl esterase